MRIDAGLDTGDMLLKWETEIGGEETAIELGARLATPGAELLARTLDEIREVSVRNRRTILGDARADSQEGRRACGLVEARARRFRIAYGDLFLGRDATGFWRASAFACGRLEPSKWKIAGRRDCGERTPAVRAAAETARIELLEVQLEGKKRMTAAAFLNGNAIGNAESLQ